jgi:coenzyme F420 hydrogenase subunit beta
MEETPSGLLLARITAELCDGCGRCRRACGGSHLAEGVLPEAIDPFKGHVLAAYCGHATDPEIRLSGQSGGVVTALFSFFLEAGIIDQALVNRMPRDGSLRPGPFLAGSRRDLLQSQGSQYCPVALNAAIPRTMGKNGKTLGLAGLPCHLHGLRNAQEFNTPWRAGIGVTIGLFCDRTLSFAAMDYLTRKTNLPPSKIASFRYKDKTIGNFPGSICIYAKDNSVVHLPSYERISAKDFFTPPRCRLCFDKMNILSDISVGDAWGIREDRAGYSVLLARTDRGRQLIGEAESAGVLQLSKIDASSVFQGQDIEARRCQWSAHTHVWRRHNHRLPAYHIHPDFIENEGGVLDAVAEKQYRWAHEYLLGRSAKQVATAVRIRQQPEAMKRKIKWATGKLLGIRRRLRRALNKSRRWG